MIPESAVASPTAVTRMRRLPPAAAGPAPPPRPGRPNPLGPPAGAPLGRIGQQLGEGRQRPASLRDRAHLEPVPEEHDRDEGGELPPDLDLEEPGRRGH